MTDFASAAMMRLIRLGLARQDVPAPAADSHTKAHVPLAQKRSLADGLLAVHGPTVLLRVGEAIEGAPPEPVMTALGLARNPFDLLARWRRLERFVHSRHRTNILSEGVAEFTLQHAALAPYPPPHAGEDLLVFGLLLALFRHSGAKGLRARPVGQRRWWLRDEVWRAAAAAADVSTWQIAWDHVRPQATEDALPDAADDVVHAARTRIEADPGRQWNVNGLARDCGQSARSLQRRLREAGARYSNLLVTARLNAASRLLVKSNTGLAEIGYACGFADQAHFTRDFKRHIGTTPSVFRTEFEATTTD